MSSELHHYKCGVDRKSNKAEVDPITTQIVRNSLNSCLLYTSDAADDP